MSDKVFDSRSLIVKLVAYRGTRIKHNAISPYWHKHVSTGSWPEIEDAVVGTHNVHFPIRIEVACE